MAVNLGGAATGIALFEILQGLLGSLNNAQRAGNTAGQGASKLLIPPQQAGGFTQQTLVNNLIAKLTPQGDLARDPYELLDTLREANETEIAKSRAKELAIAELETAGLVNPEIIKAGANKVMSADDLLAETIAQFAQARPNTASNLGGVI